MLYCSYVLSGLAAWVHSQRHFHFIYNLIICHWIVVIWKRYTLCIDLLVNFNRGLESMCYIGSRLLAPLRSFGKGHLDISQILKWTLNVHFIHSKTAYSLFMCYWFYSKLLIVYIKHWSVMVQKLLENLQYRIVRQLHVYFSFSVCTSMLLNIWRQNTAQYFRYNSIAINHLPWIITDKV